MKIASTKGILCALLIAHQGACGQVPLRERRDHEAWDPFLDTLQVRTLRFFLETTDSATGLVPDRWPSPSPSSIAAVGFALTCYPIAAERQLITRKEAAQRVLNTLRFLFQLPQHDRPQGSAGYKGFFYHFLDMKTGLRAWNCELSTVDTAWLMAGVLFCQSYFDRPDESVMAIGSLADSLYRRVDWKWAMGNSKGISIGWKPEVGFDKMDWHGYNEAMMVYLLALGSPTHPVPPAVWDYWTSTYLWAEYYGYEFVSFGPLFGHQYSHCWIDFRGIRDAYMGARGIDYFENSRRATYSQREYAKANPGHWRDYSENIWGFTACDGPGDTAFVVEGRRRQFLGYAARGVSVDWVNDDGTLAPAAAAGSLPFAPEISIPALKAMKEHYGTHLWREYGFADAFNPTFITPKTPSGWFDRDYLGIDQGPIAIMIENLRSGLVWEVMKKNPYIVRGLQKAGFSGGWLREERAKQ